MRLESPDRVEGNGSCGKLIKNNTSAKLKMDSLNTVKMVNALSLNTLNALSLHTFKRNTNATLHL